MKKIIENSLNNTVKNLDMPEVEFSLQIPKNKEHGDLATNIAFLLAKQIGDNPFNIASKIKIELEKTNLFSEVTIANPGFINMKINAEAIVDNLNFIISKENSYGANKSGKGKKVLLEFVSANPTGPLTVGHGRQAVLGDAVASILKWHGYDVTREYYYNNAGRQMRLLRQSVEARYFQELGKDIPLPEGGYKGEYIRDIVQIIRQKHGDKLHTDDIIFQKEAEEHIFNNIKSSLEKIDAALSAGQRISLDVYPYTAGSGRMIEYFNLDNINRELAEVIRLASCPAFREYEGRMLKDIAAEKNLDIVLLVHDILTAPKGDRTICIQFIIDETDIETNLNWRDMMVGSDGIPDLKGMPHPRLFGTFPKILGYYVREKKLLSLTEAIRRMTSLAATTFGLHQRGLIKEGYRADLLLFNPDTISDAATYDDPKQLAIGIEAVFVNGKLAYRQNHYTQSGSGEMLRYQRDPFRG